MAARNERVAGLAKGGAEVAVELAVSGGGVGHCAAQGSLGCR